MTPSECCHQQQSEDVNVLGASIEGDENAIASSASLIIRKKAEAAAISIEDVSPMQNRLRTASYALARPLFIYFSQIMAV